LWRLRHNTARSDVLAADQPQPVDPLFVSQADGFCSVVHVPDPALSADHNIVVRQYENPTCGGFIRFQHTRDADWPKWLGEEPATEDELLALLKPCADEALKTTKLWAT
jgi:hypothetical protein